MNDIEEQNQRQLSAIKKALKTYVVKKGLRKFFSKNRNVTPVINLSLGVIPNSVHCDDEIFDVLRSLFLQGTSVVVAAGNFGPLIGTLNPLVECPWVIGVGAASADGKNLANFSSRGLPNQLYGQPTVTAPGVNVSYTVKRRQTVNFDPEKDDPEEDVPLIASGTSFAAPQVTAIVAVLISAMWQLDVESNPALVKDLLCDMAVPMLGYAKHEVGAGFVNKEVAEDYIFRKLAFRLGMSGVWGWKRSSEGHSEFNLLPCDVNDFMD